MDEFILRFKNQFVIVGIIVGLFMLNNSIFSKYTAEENKLKIEHTKLDAGQKLIERWGQVSQDFSKVKREFPSESIIELKKFVEKTAQGSKMRIASLRTSSSDKKVYQLIGISLKSTGLYEDFLTFLKALEAKNMQAKQIKIRKASKIRSSGQSLSIDLELQAFLVK